MELLPFNANGFSISYKGQTTTPTYVQYNSGLYYHGRLTAWSYVTTIPIIRRLNASLEADENLYSGSSSEPAAEQWLERVGVDWQFSHHASFDLGLRRIIGANLPNAFQAPDLPSPQINGPLPYDFIDAGNISAAFQFLADKNEIYVVYGDPNSLSTSPGLYLKWIYYIGAGKGT